MYLIGLTGNIASGKSTVRKMLEQLGARTIDADMLAHAVTLKGTPAWHAVLKTFGDDIAYADGQIDRRKLGAIVFADPAKLKTLEGIIHPAVETELALILRDTRADIVVIEAVKLVEAGMHRYCDALWLVVAQPEEQRQRLLQTRGMTEDDAELRLGAQPPLDEKIKLAQVIINNSGSIEDTRVQVLRAFAAVRPETGGDKRALIEHWLRLSPSVPDATPALVPAVTDKTASAAAPTPPEPVLVARRARRGDEKLFARLLALLEGLPVPLSRGETLERLGKWGYWLVDAGDAGAALAAWQAENLVAVVHELWASSPDLATRAYPLLFQAIEQEAGTLNCEVIVLLAKPSRADTMRAAALKYGYDEVGLGDLHSIWRGVLETTVEPGDVLYAKRLREQVVTNPI